MCAARQSVPAEVDDAFEIVKALPRAGLWAALSRVGPATIHRGQDTGSILRAESRQLLGEPRTRAATSDRRLTSDQVVGRPARIDRAILEK